MVNESRRTIEYKDEKSSKFWEVKQTGRTFTVRYGKTGTNGQSQEKLFGGTAESSRHVAKLISEKTGKGYVEVDAALSISEAAAVSHSVTIVVRSLEETNSIHLGRGRERLSSCLSKDRNSQPSRHPIWT